MIDDLLRAGLYLIASGDRRGSKAGWRIELSPRSALGAILGADVPSLKEYLLVAQHRVQVDLYTRDDAGRWMLSSFHEPTHAVALPSIDCTLVLADVYDKIELRAV